MANLQISAATSSNTNEVDSNGGTGLLNGQANGQANGFNHTHNPTLEPATGVATIPMRNVVETPHCRHHPKEQLQYVCVVCDALICCDCIIIGEHKGHDAVPFDDAKAQFMGRLRVLTEEEDKRLAASNVVKDKIEKAIADYKTASETVLQSMQGEFRKLESALDAKKAEALVGIQECIQKNLSSYQDMIKDLTLFQACCQHNIQLCKDASQELITFKSYNRIADILRNSIKEHAFNGPSQHVSSKFPLLATYDVLDAIDKVTLISESNEAKLPAAAAREPTSPARPPPQSAASSKAPEREQSKEADGGDNKEMEIEADKEMDLDGTSKPKGAIELYKQCREGHKLKHFGRTRDSGSTSCSLCGKTTKTKADWWYCPKGCAFRLCPECQINGVQCKAQYFCQWNKRHILEIRNKTEKRSCSMCHLSTLAKELYYCVYCRTYLCFTCIAKRRALPDPPHK